MKAVAPVAPAATFPLLAPSLPAETRSRDTPPIPRLSIVIVNYLHWDDTARLVGRLQAGPALGNGTAEVMIVDNHSPPHPLMALLRRTEGVSLRRWGRNRGFARAVNEGVRLSRGEWVLLLNPDVTTAPGFLDDVLTLTERMDREEPKGGRGTGIIGLGVCNEDGSRQPSTGPFPTLAGTLARLLLPRTWRKCHLFSPRSGEAIPWASGCCLLVRRQVLDELGGLGPDFFLYYEDVDLCRRACACGWTVRHMSSPRVIHHQPLHRRGVSALLRLLTRHALLTYACKYWPGWQVRLLARLVQAEAWLKRRRAIRRGDPTARRIYTQLGRLAREMAAGQSANARRRLERVVRVWETSQVRTVALVAEVSGPSPGMHLRT